MAEAKSLYPDAPVDLLKNRIKESKEGRKPYETNWDKAKQYYDSRQWEGVNKIAWFQSEPVYNKIFEFVENMRGYLSDNKWGVDATPSSTPEGVSEDVILDMANKVNKLLDFLWGDTRMQNKLAQVLQYVFLYGTGFLKVTFDPDNIGDKGIGQIETRVLSPRYIFPDPDASDVQDASYIIEHHPVSYRWAIERYPDQRDAILALGEQSATNYNEGRGGADAGGANSSEGKRLDVYECWYKDSAMLEDEEGAEVKAYPTGRWTLMTEGGYVFEDKPCEYSMWPYVRFIEIPRPGEFFGDCTIHKALGIQETINQILRSIIDNGLWLVHGIWVADSNSGVTPSKLSGYAPRDVIIKHPGTQVERQSGVPLPPHLFDTLNAQIEAFDRVVGLPDVLRGIVPSRQPVQTTMMQQESGEVRTRERQRRVEESLADLGTLWMDIVTNHWNDKRTIRTKGALGGFDMFQITKKEMTDWRWDISVVPGSTGPMDKLATMQLLKEMRTEVGIQIPDSVFLRMSGIPGIEAAVMAAQQQEAQGVAEMQQAPPEGAMPPADPNALPPDLMQNPFADALGAPMPLQPEVPIDPNQLAPEDLAMLGA